MNLPASENTRPRIRVLAVDDSAFFLRALEKALNGIPRVELVGTAANGLAAIAEIERLQPDLITLDLEMPKMDGLETLNRIRSSGNPASVIMVSAHTPIGASKTMEALVAGADDFITKPSSGVKGDKIEYLRTQLSSKILSSREPHIADDLPIEKRQEPPETPKPKTVLNGSKSAKHHHGASVAQPYVVIAISTGGPQALNQLFSDLGPGFEGSILIVQHMPPLFTRSLAERLNSLTELTVKEASEGELVLPRHVYVAPGDYHMEVESNGLSQKIRLHQQPKVHGCRPAADFLFKSAANVYKGKCQGVVMTGMGQDGVEGAQALIDAGGSVTAQDESSCVVYGMPKKIVERGLAQSVLPLKELAASITRKSRQKPT